MSPGPVTLRCGSPSPRNRLRAKPARRSALLEGLGHRVTEIANPIPSSFKNDFLLYWSLLAFALVRGGKRTFGPSFDRDRLDNLTRGLEALAARNLHRMPLAIARLSRTRRITAQLGSQYDVLLTPTLAEVTPRIGHLDPTADYQQIIDRLIDWVAFTPLANVTGDPAMSLPLGRSASGLPIGMMFGATTGNERRLLQLAFQPDEAVLAVIGLDPMDPSRRSAIAAAARESTLRRLEGSDLAERVDLLR